jgi:polysaccharide export outer membrane protein
MRLISFFLVVVLSLNLNVSARVSQEGSSGQTQTQTGAMGNQTQTPPIPLDYVIGPGDLISIRVYQSPDLSGDVRVSAQGQIRLLFLDEPIQAAGHTEWELADLLREKLGAIMQDPRVSVQVQQARQNVAYILGAVMRPNAYPVDSETRLLNMVAASGGISDRAGNVAYILRDSVWSADSQAENQNNGADVTLASVLEAVNVREMMQGRIELNKRIYPGDIITIPEGDKVFVGGNVHLPGAYQTQGELSLSKAIALAGGLRPASKKSRVSIVRQEPGKTEVTEMIADIGEIEKDPSKDIRLQNNDVVFVPSSSMKNFGLAVVNALALQSALSPMWLLWRRRR